MYETVCHSIGLEEFDSEHDFIERNWLHIASGGPVYYPKSEFSI